jgi:hypothetical protein
MSTSIKDSRGNDFFGLLTIVFIALKLTNYISWAWWLVLLPLWWWVPLLILIGILKIGWKLFYDG